jgi:hypothetical protein
MRHCQQDQLFLNEFFDEKIPFFRFWRIVDVRGNILLDNIMAGPILFPLTLPSNVYYLWGWSAYLNHDHLFNGTGGQQYLMNGALILRVSIQFQSSVGLPDSTPSSQSYTFTFVSRDYQHLVL